MAAENRLKQLFSKNTGPVSYTHLDVYKRQVVDRAKMLLYKAQGASNSDIAERLDVNINTVKLCLSKFREGGVPVSYTHLYRSFG